MKKIFRVLKENWIKYGFETVVVTVGLLGAFALDGWRESSKEEKELMEIYRTISDDLQTDALGLDTLLIGYERKLETIVRILKKQVTLEDWIKDDSLFISFTGYTDFQESLRGLELLKLRIAASGETGHLTGRIVDYYNEHLLRNSVKRNELDNFLYDNIIYWVNNEWFSEVVVDNDRSSMAKFALEDPYFRNRLTAYFLLFKGYHSYLKTYKEEGRKLAEEINTFLEES